ncbi:hypothetical protein LPJ59_001964 [Coemansia sp. RSA 2399]|nr:hypothetical protein LPJ59_001964 [Coemansia sp. RSA 2399]
MPRDQSMEKHRREKHHRSGRSSRNRSASPEEDSKKGRKHDRERSSSSRSHRKESKPQGDIEYTSTENRFNDEALGKKFVWKKKVEQDRARGLSKEEMRAAERRRREEAELELESLRKRRELREVERAQRDEEMRRIRREQEQEKLGDWERREEEFHLTQAKKRAEIRIRNGRPKPIDVLAMNLRLANEKLSPEEVDALGSMRIDVDEPHMIVDGLGENECEELLHDVEMYLALESNAQNVEFWENMVTVCAWRLQEMRDARINSGGGDGTSRRAGSEIAQEVKDVLVEKSLGELVQLETDVADRLSGRSGVVDVDYWEQVRSQLGVAKARATLAEMHRAILERRLERLRGALKKQGTDHDESTSGPSARGAGSEAEQRKRRRLEELQRRILDEQNEPGAGVADQEGAENNGASADIERKMYETELNKAHDPSEAIFSVEASVPSKHYSWQDKHRPRKPRYFNRVHTGYEWNKYNQTHYDKDNPPPKVVQGYKFNIFYPDLIDKADAPTYRVEKDPSGGDDDETVILRFIAGPPYEDIAFRVVSREWEYNRRHGFRNTFDRGVLQLYFRFKRHHYRR